jgi:peptidyl-prolyl cis-trans isomerase SurA
MRAAPIKSRVTRRYAVPILIALTMTGTASASVVERVVAVVGEQALLLSELRERAKPFLLQLGQQAEDEAHRAAATSQLYARLLRRMVEDELEQKAANRANLNVTAAEIDDALTRIASQNGVPVARVIEEATKSGLTEVSYRHELRRQLLEAKLLNLRIQGRLRVSDDDIRAAYQKLVIDERKQLAFRAAWIKIAAPRNLDATALRARRSEADRIVAEARAGADFAALARRHSADAATRESGGFLGRMKPGQLPPALDSVALGLDSGGVSEPLRYGDDFVVLKILGRDESQLPSFEEAKDELSQRVYLDKMNKARQHWMEGLRRQTHVEIRL